MRLAGAPPPRGGGEQSERRSLLPPEREGRKEGGREGGSHGTGAALEYESPIYLRRETPARAGGCGGSEAQRAPCNL